MRNRYVHFRVSEAELTAVQAAARQEDRNPSELMREIVRQFVAARGCWPMPEAAGPVRSAESGAGNRAN